MSVQLFSGDARRILAERVPEGSVECIVTSPPYYGLRDYGLPPLVWQGDPDCEHVWVISRYYVEGGSAARSSTEAFSKAGDANKARLKAARWRQDESCEECGAWRGSLGLEPSVQMYVAHLVEVFDALYRALSPAGTCWLNIADAYQNSRRRNLHGLKWKDLYGVPWRVATALQERGWHVRADIIWQKRHPMPEPDRDRPSRSTEHIFLLTKRPRYFYAPKEARLCGASRDVWVMGTEGDGRGHSAAFPTELPRRAILAGCPEGGTVLDPFLGSGTTAFVADRLGRCAIGVDMAERHIEAARRRIDSTALLVAEVAS